MKFANGEPLTVSPTIGFAAQWLEKEVENIKTEDEFWGVILGLHQDGLNENQKASVQKRKEVNEHLIPADFQFQLNLVLDQIIQNNYEEIKKRGLTVKVK